MKQTREQWTALVRRGYPHLGEDEQADLVAHILDTHPSHRIDPVRVVKSNRAFWMLLAIGLLLLGVAFLAGKAYGQSPSEISVIQIQQDGTVIRTFAAPFKVNCLSPLVCAFTGGKLTMTAPSGGSITNNPAGSNFLLQTYNNGAFGSVAEAGLGKVLIDQGPGVAPAFADPLVQGTQAAASVTNVNPVVVGGWDGTNIREWKMDSSGNGYVNINGTVPVSGTFWQATQPVSGTFWQSTQPVSAASLPLPAGASTAAKQPALGTAGSSASDVISVQGIASMTALKVDGSAATQPVSGTFWQATQPVSGTFWQATQPVSGTLTANQGSANATPWNNNLSQVGGATLTIGQQLAAASLPVVLPAAQVTALTPPTTVTVTQGTAANLNATVTGTVAATQSGNWTARVVGNGGATVDAAIGAATAPTNQLVTGGVFNTALPTLTNGQSAAVQVDSNGRQIVAGAGTAGTAAGGVASIQGVASMTPVDIQPKPTTSSTYATSVFEADAVTTATTVKASAGNFYAYLVTNTNASACYLQVFNTTTPTLGTTAPIISMGIPATSSANFALHYPANFSTAIAVASTTASKGASTCGTGMTVTIFYF